MSVNNTLVRIYARNIYLYGTERFTARDGFNGIPEAYHGPVKANAASTFTRPQIDNAFAYGYINQTEYDETAALIPTGA
ncbi:hypothetical protein V5G20_17690 [Brevibacillus borstelensis]|uniref:hypothetical protein n=1 Tax=Brevibacillus borstelensis TaxID=45462 RepID=UPI0030D4E91E